MFTGIIETMGTVAAAKPSGGNLELTIQSPRAPAHFRDAPDEQRCGHQRGEGAAGPCEPGEHAGIYPQYDREAEKSASAGASQGVDDRYQAFY